MSRTLSELYRSPEYLTLDALGVLKKIMRPQHEETITSRISARLKRARLDGCTAAIDTCCDSNERIRLPNGAADILRRSTLWRMDRICALWERPAAAKLTFQRPSRSGHAADGACCTLTAMNSLASCQSLRRNRPRQHDKRLSSLANLDLLTLDDFLLQPVGSTVRASVLYDPLEKRCDKRYSTIVCSQRSPESWSAMPGGDTALSDAVVRRATMHYSVVIETPVID